MKNQLLTLLMVVLSGWYGSANAQGCQAAFQYNMNACPTISFQNYSYADSMDQITSLSWTFGDGNTSTSWSPSNTYAANGMYLVCLTIQTSNGCSSTQCDTVNITCIGQQSQCQASFYLDSAACPTIAPVSTSTSTGTIASYYYDFGDGSNSTSANPTHTYTANGNYLVCLTITTSDSCTSTYCDNVIINCLGQGGGCQAYFYEDSTSNCPTFDFNDGSVSASGITSYSWDFGDGGTANTLFPSHTYTGNGTYTVCLTIVANDSCTDTYCSTVNVNCIAGINETSFGALRLSPNPANETIRLDLPQAKAIDYQIIGLNGAVYTSGTRSLATEHQFNIELLDAGMYLMVLQFEGNREVIRFVKE